MKSTTLFLLFCFPTYASAACNHDVIDHDPRFACVTVVNNYDRDVVVTGYPGFNLKSGLLEETMLLPGTGGLVQVTPNPYSPYEEEKQLSCQFNTKMAKEKSIFITYYKDSYEVVPIEFKKNCTFKIVWG